MKARIAILTIGVDDHRGAGPMATSANDHRIDHIEMNATDLAPIMDDHSHATLVTHEAKGPR
jgi:hypothetical protein